MKWRFMTALMSVTLLVLLVQDIPLGFYLEQAEHERIVTSLERDAFLLAGRGEDALETISAADDASLVKMAQAYGAAGGARVVIVDRNGVAVATSDDESLPPGDSFASRPEFQSALAGQIASGHRFSQTLNQELLYVAVPVSSGDNVVGAVRLTYPDQEVTDAVNEQLGILSLVLIIAVLFAGLVGYIISLTVTRRLGRLQQVTEELAEGDLSVRADDTSGASELRSLARSFNNMANRLEALITQQRTFAADASHQLRTPLTALRLRLERAQDLLASDPDGAAERLAAAEAEADRLGNLIEGLLLLSRTEAQTAIRVKVDAALIAKDRIEHWHALADEQGVAVRYEGIETAVISAVESALEQIIDNYLDNALAVSPHGSTLTVRVESINGFVTVHVLDEGPGMSERDCERAFDRFWRGKSDKDGSGLGLAIVAQLAQVSGGQVQLQPRSTGGIDASARFPLAR